MKKQWISIKCGLSRDPKHRRAMANSIWLFMHMLDLADWDTGIIPDWRDEAEAEEMGMELRTLREQRRELDQLGYITCKQKQRGQSIVIHNWTNPREYTGEIYNKKQGDNKASPTNDENQGYTQGYVQGSINNGTPTYSPNTKESIKTDERFAEISRSLALLSGGILNSTSADLITIWLEKHTNEWILKAIDLAKAKKAKSANYVDSILIGWEANGYPKSRAEKVQDVKREVSKKPTQASSNLDIIRKVAQNVSTR